MVVRPLSTKRRRRSFTRQCLTSRTSSRRLRTRTLRSARQASRTLLTKSRSRRSTTRTVGIKMRKNVLSDLLRSARK
jgi:hypothetical protein